METNPSPDSSSTPNSRPPTARAKIMTGDDRRLLRADVANHLLKLVNAFAFAAALADARQRYSA